MAGCTTGRRARRGQARRAPPGRSRPAQLIQPDTRADLPISRSSFCADDRRARAACSGQSGRVRRASSWLLGGIAGAAIAIAAWLLLVPWDLSELDKDGSMLERGGDDYGPQIAAVAVVVVLVGLAATLKAATRRAAPVFVASGLTAWAALFAWRAGTAEVSGANMFVVPLVMLMIPAVVLMPLLVRRVGRLAQRSRRFS